MSEMRTWERRGLYQFANGAEWTQTLNGEGEKAGENWLALAYGRRSDGRNFTLSINVTAAELADDARRTALVDEKLHLLDTFLDPRCECTVRAGAPNTPLCDWHRTTLAEHINDPRSQ